MEGLPEELEAAWQKVHYESSEEAFEKVAKEGQAKAGPSFFKKSEEESEVVAAVSR